MKSFLSVQNLSVAFHVIQADPELFSWSVRSQTICFPPITSSAFLLLPSLSGNAGISAVLQRGSMLPSQGLHLLFFPPRMLFPKSFHGLIPRFVHVSAYMRLQRGLSLKIVSSILCLYSVFLLKNHPFQYICLSSLLNVDCIKVVCCLFCSLLRQPLDYCLQHSHTLPVK